MSENTGQRLFADDPLAFTIPEAVAKSRSSRTALYGAIARGELPARKHGRRTLILKNDLERWLAHLPPLKPKGTGKDR